jgi:hypothetical protein
MLRFLLLFFFLSFFTLNRLQACSCVYIETFCETLQFDDTIYHELIVYGRVTKITNQGMEVAVAERLYGNDNSASIFVRSGNGADCGESANRFELGQQLILALQKYYTSTPPDDITYWLSICGINWLVVENGYVKGPIAPGKVLLRYEDFKKASTCEAFKQFQPTGPGDLDISVYPNPVRDRLFVKVDESVESFDYIISDICGKIVLRGIREGIEAESQITIELPIEELSSGLYFLKITSGRDEKTFKLMMVTD